MCAVRFLVSYTFWYSLAIDLSNGFGVKFQQFFGVQVPLLSGYTANNFNNYCVIRWYLAEYLIARMEGDSMSAGKAANGSADSGVAAAPAKAAPSLRSIIEPCKFYFATPEYFTTNESM